ncbi:MAG: DNA-directed RNA polymerase subunit beta, partial [Verrucomicrobiae bacterium]|nr:DNA-directed RNA polymerase subunit beta [Verrucomicrobiae bacterium]
MAKAASAERLYFGKIKEVIETPNLIEVQLESYKEFLQQDVAPSERSTIGLEAVFREVFPIDSYDEKFTLDFARYEVGEPKLTSLQALREGETFSAPLYVTFALKDETGTKEERVYMGELPLMTRRGTFVINGAERVVVSQLIRSPGVYFSVLEDRTTGRALSTAKLIPNRGAWLEFETSKRDVLSVKVDRKRKFPVTTLLRAIGYSDDATLLSLFTDVDTSEEHPFLATTLEKDP